MSIEVQNITKLYGEQKALHNVSFSIDSGAIVGFLGPNGAGKSTMMKIITGFIPPTEGTVKVNGLDILEHSLEVRKHIGYLPENNPLYTDMYVREYLTFVARLYKIKGKQVKVKVDEMVERTGLTLEQRKKIGALSKGYRQRVGLAQALIHDPSVLILDEPTSGLDPNQIVEIRNLISDVGKHKTVMLSTHIMQEVEAICDKVMIINAGVLVANDSKEELTRQNVKKSQTVVIEFDKSIEKELFHSIDGVVKVHGMKNFRWLIECEPGMDIRADLFQFAIKHDLTVLSLQKKENSLEEVFRELTQ